MIKITEAKITLHTEVYTLTLETTFKFGRYECGVSLGYINLTKVIFLSHAAMRISESYSNISSYSHNLQI